MATLFISHDLGVVAGIADRVAVMYAGRIVEEADAATLFARPRHPYTAALLRASRDLSGPSLPGMPPQPPRRRADGTLPPGCSFAPRCVRAQADCREITPPLRALPPTLTEEAPHAVRCHYPLEDDGQARPASGSAAVFDRPDAVAPARGRATAALRLDALSVAYVAPRRWPFGPRHHHEVVQRVSLAVAPGEVLALVGESGSGKTTLARAILQLLAPAGGSVWLGNDCLSALWRRTPLWLGGGRPRLHRSMRPLRRKLQAVFQDPQASLDPRQTALEALIEPLVVHGAQPGPGQRLARRQAALALLEEVGLGAALAGRLPHALSGGQRQRLALARALAPGPSVLLADEPTSALDVCVKGQVLTLLHRLTVERALATVFVSHDLAAVRALAQQTAVMVWGHVVELGPTAIVASAPHHPYSQALLAAEPQPDPVLARARLAEQAEVDVPAPAPARPTGCPYHPRCPLRVARCSREVPELVALAPRHAVACHVVAPARAQTVDLTGRGPV